MVKINGKDFRLYDLDSENTIYERIAGVMNTLPKYLIFPDGIPNIEDFYTDEDNIVLNLHDIIREGENIISVYDEIKKYKDKTIGSLSMSEIISNFIMLNKNFKTKYNQARTSLSHDKDMFNMFKSALSSNLREDINKITSKNENENKDEIKINLDNLETSTHLLDEEIKKNLKLVLDTEKKFENFDKIETLDYTKFNLEKITYEFELNIENTSSILEIFNTITLNKDIPFAATNNFYKILKGFKPPIEWVNLFDRSTSFRNRKNDINRETNIVLKILQDKKIKNKDQYIDIIISMKDINTIKISCKYDKKFISTKKIITNCQNILKTKNEPKNNKEVNVSGVYYMVQKINKLAMLDMILNDPLFSNLLCVNERNISILSSFYIYFKNKSLGEINFRLTPIKVSSKNIESLLLSNINEDEIVLNKNLIRIRISKCDNINKINDFQKLFSKLIKLYNDNQKQIIKLYHDYGCVEVEDKDEIVEKVKSSDRDDLKNIDPYIFNTNTDHSRQCQKRKRPRYLTEDEKETKILEGKGENIIKFPKEKIEGTDSVPKYYICDKPGYPYPGLQPNKFKGTKENVPYLPCCFTTKQTETYEYKDYYDDDDNKTTTSSLTTSASSKVNKSTYTITDFKKKLGNKIRGLLPPKLDKLFLLGDQTKTYLKVGMIDTKSSFLNCVMHALGRILPDDLELSTILKKEREKLSKFPGYCKQEMFDYSFDEIKNKINNIDEYLDPKLFVHLLELYYDCNIFLFSVKNEGEFIIPNNIQCHYKLKNKNNCIFIVENSLDKNTYPSCELIVNDSNKSLFKFSENISTLIFNVFDSYIKAYALNTEVSPINLNWPIDKLNVTSQIFDAYGKTRILDINYNSKNISLFTTPIQPLKLDSIVEMSKPINKTDIETAKYILNIIGAINVSLIPESNPIKLVGEINNVIIYILIDDKKDEDFKMKYSAMLEYNKYKKLSRYVIEYLFWLFSTYLNNNNITPESIPENYKNIFLEFKNQYIKIDHNVKYEDIKKNFSVENSSIIKDKKLVLRSDDNLKRLFYILRLKLTRNMDEIFNYKNKTMIENYYLDITDFTLEINQVILQGEKSFYRFLNEKTRNIIYKKINIIKEEEQKNEDNENNENNEDNEDNEDGKEKIINENLERSYPYVTTPYFFKNNIIDSKNIYIAQNIDSYLKAIKISMIWNKYKYNPGVNIDINEKDNLHKNFTLYSYISSNNIKIYNVEGEENNFGIKIIGYKINLLDVSSPVNFYTVLLPL